MSADAAFVSRTARGPAGWRGGAPAGETKFQPRRRLLHAHWRSRSAACASSWFPHRIAPKPKILHESWIYPLWLFRFFPLQPLALKTNFCYNPREQPARFCLSGAELLPKGRSSCNLKECMKKRTIVYIDGYNLYYRLLRGTKDKWLDLCAFARGLLNDSHDVVAVKYFTSMVVPHPYDAASVERQNVYLQAVSLDPKIQIVFGFYKKKPAVLPARSATCRACDEAKNGFVRVYKFEEKRSDVNMAVSVVRDVALNAADSFVLVTGDSDQVATVLTARKTFGKQVLVFDPHEKLCDDLKKAASYYKNISRGLPSQCQLPLIVSCGDSGRSLHCPEAWR